MNFILIITTLLYYLKISYPAFIINPGFVKQLENRKITKIETDIGVAAVAQVHTSNLKAYTAVAINDLSKLPLSKVIANDDDGNVTTNNIYDNSNTRLPTKGGKQKFNSWNFAKELEILQDTRVPQTLDPNPSLNIAMGHLARAQAFADKASYPRSTNPDGTIKRVTLGDWTSGFFPGSLWLMYENTKDEIWRTRAEQWTMALEGQKNNTSTHDLGFILNSSFGAGYRLTGNEKYKAILLQGAKSLSTRFNSTVGCIKSWNNPTFSFPVIIDNMMNLEILFWATRLSGDSSYYKIAVMHALTTMANHFRPDNSSYHVVDYNPNDGSIISKVTHQGLNNLSDWARGQAWGLYGFTMCYRETGNARFLDMAKKIADFYIRHPNMPADLVPFWDFDAVDYRDATAACIASSALLELSQFIPEKSTIYYNFGINTLKSISLPAYTASIGTNNDFILKHSVGNKPKNTEVDKPLNYADYYFIEALLRHKKPAPMLTAIAGNRQVTLKWNASTGAGYYSIKRGSVSGGPYTTIASNVTNTNYTNTGLSSGKTYYYKVTSWNTIGQGGISGEASATTNTTPTVSIINPANNESFTEPAIIRVVADAEDADGTISKVELYNGTALFRIEHHYPYGFTLNNLRAGNYTFMAKATDDKGAVTTSAIVKVSVVAPGIPFVNTEKNSVENVNAKIFSTESLSIKASPNPAKNIFNIYTTGCEENKNMTISVVSVSGVVIKTIHTTSNQLTQMDVSSLRSGVYFLKVISGDKVMYMQFVKL